MMANNMQHTQRSKRTPETAAIRAHSELQHIMAKALSQVGAGGSDEGDCHELANAIVVELAQLYIRTPEQLKDALDIPEVLGQITSSSGGCIKGMLLPAVRAELEHFRELMADVDKIRTIRPGTSCVGLVQSTRGAVVMGPGKSFISKKPQVVLNKPLLRELVVARVDVTHLAQIDQISQTFFARLLVILRIKDGALDSDLTQECDDFPFDEDGRPTFRPSARWYNNQIDFPNANNLRVIDSKVTTEGNDLQLIKRIEGSFFERFDLHDFPFDEQDLTVTISANCANEGPVPVQFVVNPGEQLGVDTVNFAHADIWDLSPNLSATVTTVGATKCRRFPAVHLRANVKRHSSFLLINAAMPVSAISFLSLATFFVPPKDTADRLEISIIILFTAVAFKFTTASYLPMISYMTLIDKFTLWSTVGIVMVCIWHTLLGMLDTWVEVSNDILDLPNKVFFGVFASAWAGVQMWFFRKRVIIRRAAGGDCSRLLPKVLK
ncbi:hypothetical protein ACHAXR_005896 [Thalassiosira sp. AJA248-18]